MNQPLSIAQVVGILMLMFALWIGGWTLAIAAPKFAALQENGIQKSARVNQKLPYRSICTGRTCKFYVLQVRFFTAADSPQPGDLGELIFAELEVREAVYNQIQVDDPIRLVYLKQNPKEVWPAETILRWRPWTNYTVSSLLLLGGVGLFRWKRKPSKAAHR